MKIFGLVIAVGICCSVHGANAAPIVPSLEIDAALVRVQTLGSHRLQAFAKVWPSDRRRRMRPRVRRCFMLARRYGFPRSRCRPGWRQGGGGGQWGGGGRGRGFGGGYGRRGGY
jgi:hypothetical protein